MILAGVDRYRVSEPLFEGLRVLLSHRGAAYSPAYIQGISGAAFRIAGICPCAPTCSSAMQPAELASLLGYDTRPFSLSTDGADSSVRILELIDQVKEEIMQNRPALVWHAFTNFEWDVVCGFDESKNTFLGRGSYLGFDELAEAPQTRAKEAGHTAPAYNALFLGERSGVFNAQQAEWAALEESVRHAHSERNKDEMAGDKWVFLEGLLCYNRWVKDFQNSEKAREVGDAYCSTIYSQTHRAAAEFLMEIVPKYPMVQAHLQQAAMHFSTEADSLTKVTSLIGWQSPQGPDAERNRRVVEILTIARDAYARGIDEIETALPT